MVFFPGNCIYLKSFEVASRTWFCRREKSRGEWNSIVDHGICLRGLIKTYAQVGSSPERESTWPPTFRNWTKFLASKVSAASIDQRWWFLLKRFLLFVQRQIGGRNEIADQFGSALERNSRSNEFPNKFIRFFFICYASVIHLVKNAKVIENWSRFLFL